MLFKVLYLFLCFQVILTKSIQNDSEDINNRVDVLEESITTLQKRVENITDIMERGKEHCNFFSHKMYCPAINTFAVRRLTYLPFFKARIKIRCQQKCQKYFFINMWRKSVFDIYFTEFGTVMTTVLPVLFRYCYKYCYSDSRKLWAVMKAGGLAL